MEEFLILGESPLVLATRTQLESRGLRVRVEESWEKIRDLGSFRGVLDLRSHESASEAAETLAKRCLEAKRPLLSLSAPSQKLRAMHDDALSCGVPLIYGLGLIEGAIEHLCLRRILDQITFREDRFGAKGKILSLCTYFGSLPTFEQEAALNPFHLKFFEDHDFKVLSLVNRARYLDGGHLVELSPGDVLTDTRLVQIPGVGEFEAFPFGDALRFTALHGLSEIPTVQRGVLRHPGHCESWKRFWDLGLLRDDLLDDREIDSPADVLALVLDCSSDLYFDNPQGLKDYVLDRLRLRSESIEGQNLLRQLEWLGFFSTSALAESERASTVRKFLIGQMRRRMSFGATERDLALLHQRVEVDFGGRRELHNLTVAQTRRGKGFAYHELGAQLVCAAALLVASVESVVDSELAGVCRIHEAKLASRLIKILDSLELPIHERVVEL